MAIEILGGRGWECGHTMMNSADVFTAVSGSVAVSTTSKKTGAYSLAHKYGGTSTAASRIAIPGSPANPSVSFWIDLSSGYTVNDTFRVRYVLDSGLTIELRWATATHTFNAYVDGALVASGTVEVSVNTWFHVQFYVVVALAGSIGVKIDGHQSINYSGDTQPGAEAGADYFYMTGSAGGYPIYVYIDDLVWGSGGYLGTREVYDKLAASDSVVAWTPATGAVNYAMEDEVPPSDADYNETAVTARVDKFGLAALSLTDRVVDAVIPWSRVADPDAWGSSIKVGIDSAATVSTATRALAAAYEYYWGNVDEVDPADSAAWNQAKVDALLHMKESVIP